MVLLLLFLSPALLRASLGQPLRLHPASDLAGLAAGAGPAASPCSSPWPIGCTASSGIKGEGFARHPRPVAYGAAACGAALDTTSSQTAPGAPVFKWKGGQG